MTELPGAIVVAIYIACVCLRDMAMGTNHMSVMIHNEKLGRELEESMG